MAKQIINTGSALGDRTGDNGRVAFTKVNENFAELYTDRVITPAEEAAGLTNADITHGYPPGDVRRYGLSESASGATNRAALEAAIAVCGEQGGGIIEVPEGQFEIDATVTIDHDNIIIRGQGRPTIWEFNPSGADVLFDFDQGADSVWFCGIENCQFFSSNSSAKTAIRVDDARTFRATNIVIAQGNWPGSASIGIEVHGRELVIIDEPHMICARPLVLGVNPHNTPTTPTIHTDFFRINDGILGSTETTGACLEFEDGVNISNMVVSSIAFVLGKWGIKWVDTTSTLDSYALRIVGCRTEQAEDATGYSVELNSTAQDIKHVLIEGFFFDNSRNGLKLRKADDCLLKSCNFGGGSGVTNLDVTFQSQTLLKLENTFVQLLSTATLTNGVLVDGSPHNSGFSLLPMNATYRFNETNLISQRPALTYNSIREWHYAVSLADDALINLPVSDVNGVTLAHVKVSAVGATQHEGGEVTFSQLGTKLIGGTTNFVLTNTDAKLCVFDSGTADITVRNRLGETATVLIDAYWTTL